ncbi:Microtubule-actin cross-linking factor 1 isoforms 1/2/3/5 [Dissostichus eleginoides]|uniref:Microtubule-actin cross-linking factor 1 isoforms 1/2/3/5 n=1 Tax=Dissostichus eleginoides TaxID=100907 RepID=A0AAD9C5D8_DISEL|nr:Microtubule-actin cross-linking factor 1 isoforms 1/2/3/5 [Dissostichus eleginoides]
MATRKDRRRDQTPGEGHGERSSVPSPGDTLPWNLSKHQRVKRSKSSTGEVLDPAERAVIRIAVNDLSKGKCNPPFAQLL